MIKKSYIILVVVLAISLGFASAANADRIEGTGTLTAQGDGVAGLRGKGSVTISGDGILWFKDHAGDATWSISGEGERRDFPRGWIEYVGFNGEFEAEGSKITVVLSGENISLFAEGTGKVILWGEGTYEVGKIKGEWSSTGQIMVIRKG
jgi:hypothetical protein